MPEFDSDSLQFRVRDVVGLSLAVVSLFAMGARGCGGGGPEVQSESPSGAFGDAGTTYSDAGGDNPNQGKADSPDGGDDSNEGSGDETSDPPDGNRTEDEDCNTENAEVDDNCVSGLSCVADRCIESAPLRVTAIWSDETDLDLHVETPNGETLNFQNRRSSGGGEFEKDDCINTSCEGRDKYIETARWPDGAPDGTYRFWVRNFNGANSADVAFDVRVNGERRRFTTTVGGGEGDVSETLDVTVGDKQNEELFEFVEPREGAVTPQSVAFEVRTDIDAVRRVTYRSGGKELGSSTDAGSRFEVEHTFEGTGERAVAARGLDESGDKVAEALVTIEVSEDGTVACAAGPADNLADCLLQHHESGNIVLYDRQPGTGREDGADALSNIEDVAAGRQAATSNYGDAADFGTTPLSEPMLEAMVDLIEEEDYSFRVTSIAGGDHSPNSYHYYGQAFDVDLVDGEEVAGVSDLTRSFSMACAMYGAEKVLGPSDNDAHSNHIHCRFGT